MEETSNSLNISGIEQQNSQLQSQQQNITLVDTSTSIPEEDKEKEIKKDSLMIFNQV